MSRPRRENDPAWFDTPPGRRRSGSGAPGSPGCSGVRGRARVSPISSGLSWPTRRASRTPSVGGPVEQGGFSDQSAASGSARAQQLTSTEALQRAITHTFALLLQERRLWMALRELSERPEEGDETRGGIPARAETTMGQPKPALARKP